jgi:hypothetical protein
MFMTLKLSLALLCLTTMLQQSAYAQPMLTSIAPVYNVSMMQKADSIKKIYEKDGFELLREAEISMTSQYEKPVIVSLKEGTWYHVCFIGDESSKFCEIRVYDWYEKRLIFEKQKANDPEGNVINFDYIPRFTEFHMIKPLQVNKRKKGIQGYLMLFKKTVQPK